MLCVLYIHAASLHSRLLGLGECGPSHLCLLVGGSVWAPGRRAGKGFGQWGAAAGLAVDAILSFKDRNLDPGRIPKRMLGHCPRALDPHKRGGTWGDHGLLATKAVP